MGSMTIPSFRMNNLLPSVKNLEYNLFMVREQSLNLYGETTTPPPCTLPPIISSGSMDTYMYTKNGLKNIYVTMKRKNICF